MVGLLVKVFPLTPNRGAVCFSFINLSNPLYSFITSWMRSLFSTALITLLLADTSFSFTVGKGTTFDNWPFFTLKSLSRLSTFSCVGSVFPQSFSIFLGTNGSPLNLSLMVLLSKGLFHFLPDFSERVLFTLCCNSSLPTLIMLLPCTSRLYLLVITS